MAFINVFIPKYPLKPNCGYFVTDDNVRRSIVYRVDRYEIEVEHRIEGARLQPTRSMRLARRVFIQTHEY